MAGEDKEFVFADISLLVEYCAPYFEDYEYSEKVVEYYGSSGGEFIISKGTFYKLNNKINNRKRLWNHLIREATEHIKDDSLSEVDFKSDVLNYTSLEKNLEFGLDNEYHPDIQSLRSIVEDTGLEEFRNLVDNYRTVAKVQRKELEFNKEFNTFSRHGSGSPWDIEAALTDIVDSTAQFEALLDFAHWRRTNQGIYLIGCMSKICQDKSRAENIVEPLTNNNNVDIYSSKEVCESVLTV
ncbi:MAG: hypothetical protein ABEI86_14730 [Halobacteriaceae archaeon]